MPAADEMKVDRGSSCAATAALLKGLRNICPVVLFHMHCFLSPSPPLMLTDESPCSPACVCVSTCISLSPFFVSFPDFICPPPSPLSFSSTVFSVPCVCLTICYCHGYVSLASLSLSRCLAVSLACMTSCKCSRIMLHSYFPLSSPSYSVFLCIPSSSHLHPLVPPLTHHYDWSHDVNAINMMASFLPCFSLLVPRRMDAHTHDCHMDTYTHTNTHAHDGALTPGQRSNTHDDDVGKR